ncbi:RNA polymerase sigma factor [Bariatricus sp. SGI.154]|uniref:RNA polymerase sigma factor n=1 Tax=Bariatricus sp. SGI.154 TaxID=3420549 RepID=UPI003D01D78D
MKKRCFDDSTTIDILEKNAQEGMVLMVEQYTGLLWKVISFHLANPEDIKECINDTFTQFYLHRDRFDAGKASLPVYLTSIARNLAVSRYRKEIRHKSEPLPMDYALTDQQIETAEIKTDLKAALAELREDELQIIRMKYYGGMTVQEIADSLNLPYETVKKRHQRSISKLRRIMLLMLLVLLLALASACAYRVLVYYEIIPDFLHIGILEDTEDDMADDTDIGDDTRSATPLVIDSSPLDDMSEELPDIQIDYNNTEATEAVSEETDDTLPRLTWIPGYGSAENTSSPDYTLLSPVTVESDSYTYKLDTAYYKDNILSLDIILTSDKWEVDNVETQNLDACLSSIRNLPNGILYCGDQIYTTVVQSLCFRDDGIHQEIDFKYIDLPDSDKDSLELIIQSYGTLIPFTLTRSAGVTLDSYTSETGKYGNLAIYPRLENGSLIIAIYPINKGDATISPALIRDYSISPPEDDITAVADDGTVLTGSCIRYSPMSDRTYYEWDFGKASPGNYTLRVPYLCLSESFPENFSISVNLKELSWEDTIYQIPGGSVHIEDCKILDVTPWETIDDRHIPIDKSDFNYWKLWLHYDSTDTERTITGVHLLEYCSFLPNVNDVEHSPYYYTPPYSSSGPTRTYPVPYEPMTDLYDLNSISASGTMEYFIPIDEEYFDATHFQLVGNSMGKSYKICIDYRWNQSFDILFHVDSME